ncbi:HtaA domain-containing protein [Streptomyces sp. NPDC051567]|uniref:HtaA domain-containing protein n=1 Tax=Streptomyces sp. NPDC051567 TaxID=3365660 RepID=UPI0037A7B258
MTSPRRSITVAAAILTAAALGTGAFVLPATAATSTDTAPAADRAADRAAAPGLVPKAGGAPPAPLKIIAGTLDWGVVKSYRDYVTGMAKGRATAADGATVNPDGSFRFGAPTGQYDPAAGHVVKAAFKGSVTFTSPAPPAGHGFEVTLSDLRIDTGTKKVTADVTKSGATAQDVPLADVAFGGRSMESLTTTLTQEAADQLGSSRYKGLAGDPLTAALKFETPPVVPEPTAPTTAPDPTGTGTAPLVPETTNSPAPTATQTSPPAADGPQKVLSGRLVWGVKESFRRYVIGDPANPSGTITPGGGAARSGTTFSFAFGKGELDAKARKLAAAFEGDLRFHFPGHGLDLAFSNIRVVADGRTGTLVLDVRTATGVKKDVPFATLDLSATDYTTKNGLLELAQVPAVFTEQGSAAFANDGSVHDDYKPGRPMDALNLSVAVDKDAVLPPAPTTGGTGTTGGSPGTTTGAGTTGGSGSVGGSGSGSAGGSVGGSAGGNLAATGAELPAAALLAASGTVVAAGAGAVYLARRRRTARL